MISIDTYQPVLKQISKELNKITYADPTQIIGSFATNWDEDRNVVDLVSTLTAECPSEMRARLHEEYFGWGPLTELINDPSITEILINGPDSIWIERSGRLTEHPDRFLTPLTFRNFLQRLNRLAEIQTTLDCPFADGQYQNFRIHIITPPVTDGRVVVSLRCHPNNPWTLKQLGDSGWASDAAFAQLKLLINQKMNFLIVGSTGCGKTSVLNACLQELATNERVVMIEDTSELKIPNQVSSKLLTRRDPNSILREITQTDLLKQSLRMRPDRLVMGEIRGPEAKDLLMTFSTGHSGCMGTLHADSARQALLRLEMLIQLGAAQWSLHAVRSLILLSLDSIVVLQRQADGSRRLEGIYKITSLEDVGFLLEKTI
jgi:pilus assembly protein CpaF